MNFYQIDNVQLRNATGSLVGAGLPVVLLATPGSDDDATAERLGVMLENWMGRAYAGASFTFTDLGHDVAAVAAVLAREWVGRTLRFAAEPYHFGQGVVEAVEPHPHSGRFVVTLRTTDATETSSMGGHNASKPFNGRQLRLYPIAPADFVRTQPGDTGPRLRHVYPCG